jgi:hypothetical protein
MWKAFVEVLQDLWSFLVQAIVRASKPRVNIAYDDVTTKRSWEGKVGVDLGYQVYVVVDKLHCYPSEDQQDQKHLITSFAYGESLKHLRTEGRLALVAKESIRCWVDATGITDDTRHVFPSFSLNETYRATNEEVIKLRKCLEVHFKKRSEFLESEEYVLYRLLRDSFLVPWEALHLLPSKSWYQKFLNRRDVAIYSEPRTYSVLEYLNDAGAFIYGFVTAVQPDMTIQVESIGREEPGEFRIEQFSRIEWERWRPVFITFS